MLKEYTLKVTVQVGGETEEQCDEGAEELTTGFLAIASSCEITHEEVVQPDEVERE